MHPLAQRLNGAVDTALLGFVQADTAAQAFKLGLASGKNVLFHGVGGYGKSEMANAVLANLGGDVRVWKSQLHVESTISSLYGGIDMKVLRETGEERYRVKMSLLTCDVAVLEEMLDAPASVLASLKTLFTEGRLLNGGQTVDSQCKLAVALTNKTPEEVASLGRSEAATLERFPIQVEIAWKEDNADKRLELYRKVHLESHAASNGREGGSRLGRAELAQLPQLVKGIRLTEEYLRKKAAFTTELKKLRDVSPRMDVWADQLAKAAAFLAGRPEVDLDDLFVLRFLVAEEVSKTTEFEKIFYQTVQFARKMDEDCKFLDAIRCELDGFQSWWSNYQGTDDLVSVVATAKQAKATKAKLQGHKSLEQNQDRRKQILDELESLSSNMLLSLAN